MAPEALEEGRPHDGKAADVWSLGVLLVNLLSRGEYPFAGRDEEALRAAIASVPPRLPEHVSGPCRELMRAMLEKEPNRRADIEAVRRESREMDCACQHPHPHPPTR